MADLDFSVKLQTASSGFDGKSFWGQARAGCIPPNQDNTNPTVVLTMQKALRSGSDLFYALHSMRSSDFGQTWTTPEEQSAFQREQLEDGNQRTVCDFWPKWHAGSGKLLGIGHTAYYTPENKIVPGYRPRQTAYAVYDAKRHEWPSWHVLEMPDYEPFYHAGAGCSQRVDLDNGDILLPFYFGLKPKERPSSAAVMRCRFDGETLTYIEHGSELTCNVKRGFTEPSLAYFQGRYFLALRNDEANHVTVGEDGLTFGEPVEWRFDDGEPLGSYNTQQHWVQHGDALYLVYTRCGLNNDHVFRHRAPLLMGQVDPDRLCIIRETEQTLVPERGARLGNFGICDVSPEETWVIVSEWMQPEGCEKYGSDNSVFVARILWA